MVHNAVASGLGFPTVSFGPSISQIQEPDGYRDQTLKPENPAAPASDQVALKKRLRALERSNHNLRTKVNNLTNEMVTLDQARTVAEAQASRLAKERDDFKTLASELEQSQKRLTAELLETRQKRETLAVEIRQQSVEPNLLSNSEGATVNREPTPRPQGGPSANQRISPPTLTVAERNEMERLASVLMANLVRLEGHKIRSNDITSVTGIATGWKRVIEHLLSLGHVVYDKDFLRISDIEKIRRNLK